MSYRLLYDACMSCNRKQFLRAVERGQALLAELKNDYPELRLSPVFSRFGPRSGQCALTIDIKKIVLEFPEMLAGSLNRERTQGAQKVGTDRRAVRDDGHEKHENSQREAAKLLGAKSFSTAERVRELRDLLSAAKQAEKEGEKEIASNLWKEAAAVEKTLLDPKLELYCGDVLIEYRPGYLKYESLRRLQQDSRLPPGLNTVGNIRVIAGSLEFLSNTEK